MILQEESLLRESVPAVMMCPMNDTTLFKKRLTEELSLVERELKSVGQKNPSNPSDWVARPEAGEASPADPNDLADKFESLATDEGIVGALEVRWSTIKRALKKIEEGTYGVCEISGENIETERLDANPAARTCIAHVGEEEGLPA